MLMFLKKCHRHNNGPSFIRPRLLQVNRFFRAELFTLMFARGRPMFQFDYELTDKPIFYDNWKYSAETGTR
jgi:hypothetical protein